MPMIYNTMEQKKICLSMIVKNESKIIERCLRAVIPIIDTYCICDTGSTDDTKEKITSFFKTHNMEGEVFDEPFKNFGYNRTIALQRAEKWAEYALLVDADMELVIGSSFDKNKLKDDSYNVLQKSGIHYYNTRLIKTSIGATCVGPTHEYYNIPSGICTRIDEKELYINDLGDGGCKDDKFIRDIKLLTEGLKAEPNNERYMFYIANSYRDIGKYEQAIVWYNQRIEKGGWKEEVFDSMCNMGKCYLKKGDHAQGIYFLMKAYDYYPTRAESLYEIVKYYREHGNNTLGQLFCDIARKIPYPQHDVLFIQNSVYEYLLDYEHSILAFYTKSKVPDSLFINLLNREYNYDNVLSNFQYYVKSICEICDMVTKIDFTNSCKFKAGTFNSSSPCIIPYKNGYLMNIRYVNYKIYANGQYDFICHGGRPFSVQKCVELSSSYEKINEHILDDVENPANTYITGVEDVRLFPHNDIILFTGTVSGNDGRICVGGGTLDLSTNNMTYDVYESPQNSACEKNWIYFESDGKTKTIYCWYPLTIGIIENNKYITEQTFRNVPHFFKHLRGSTNGFVCDNEIWFVCHLVEYSAPRKYYHCFVILDIQTMQLKRHSILFKIERSNIEYCLGLIVNTNHVTISYSTNDGTSKIAKFTKKSIEEHLMVL